MSHIILKRLVLNIVVLSNLLFVALPISAQSSTSELKPGSTFFVDFPQLGPTWAKQPSRMGVYIPTDYTAGRRYPLLVWFGGGYGGDDPGAGKAITAGSGFICVGLPYKFQDDSNENGEKGGWHGTPWSYYRTMLDVLHERVPNIHPKQRICGGFSSGGTAILRQIQVSDGDFQKYFFAFMPGGAGWDMGGLDKLKGRPMLALIGEKDERFEGYASLKKNGLAVGVDLKLLVFSGEGHSMPDKYFPEMREWMMQKVVRREIKTLPADLNREMAAANWGKAYQIACDLQAMADAGSSGQFAAGHALERLNAIGKAEADKLCLPGVQLAAMQKFVADWEGSDFSRPVREKCNVLAEEQLGKILSQTPVSPDTLKKFLGQWDNYPINAKAMEAYDAYARVALESINSKPAKALRGESLARFVAQWNPAPCVAGARQLLEQLGQKELAEIKVSKNKSEKKSKLESFLRTYKNTMVADEARQLLDESRRSPGSKR